MELSTTKEPLKNTEVFLKSEIQYGEGFVMVVVVAGFEVGEIQVVSDLRVSLGPKSSHQELRETCFDSEREAKNTAGPGKVVHACNRSA